MKFNKIVRHGLLMRSQFDFSNLNIGQCFPGHMAKGMNEMQSRLKNIDCIIEVHDARIPFTGRNALFEKKLLGIKPHLLILNKIDLSHHTQINKISKHYASNGISPIIFTNCKNSNSTSIKNMVITLNQLVKSSDRYNRQDENDITVMVIGIPNVGKSSLINALRTKNLRRTKATRVGAIPGITRSVLERIKVSENPPIYLLDTPGVLSPHINNIETGIKLALVNTILSHSMENSVVADYLLYRLNMEGNHNYINFCGLEMPSDDIKDIVKSLCIKNKYLMKVRLGGDMKQVFDVSTAIEVFLRTFRNGNFGPIILDDIPTS